MSGSKNLEWNATRHAVYTVGRLTSRRGPYARERERDAIALISSYLYFCRLDGSETTFPTRGALYSLGLTVKNVLILQIYPIPKPARRRVGGCISFLAFLFSSLEKNGIPCSLFLHGNFESFPGEGRKHHA
jgi:hypothetical protein